MGEEELLQQPEIILQNPLESPPEEFSGLRLHSSSSTAADNRRRRLNSLHQSPYSGHSHTRKRPAVPAKKLFLDTPPPPEHLRCTVSGSVVPPNAPSPPAQPSSLPPTLLRRCTSVPTPALTPPAAAAKSASRTSSSSAPDLDDSPISKVLSSWREFNQWIEGEFMAIEQQQQTQELDLHAKQSPSLVTVPSSTTTEHNTDDEYDICNEEDKDNDNGFVNSDKDDSAASEFDESLSVKRDGERLNVHFKCHCGNGYQFLLVDGNCYYKLM